MLPLLLLEGPGQDLLCLQPPGQDGVLPLAVSLSLGRLGLGSVCRLWAVLWAPSTGWC